MCTATTCLAPSPCPSPASRVRKALLRGAQAACFWAEDREQQAQAQLGGQPQEHCAASGTVPVPPSATQSPMRQLESSEKAAAAVRGRSARASGLISSSRMYLPPNEHSSLQEALTGGQRMNCARIEGGRAERAASLVVQQAAAAPKRSAEHACLPHAACKRGSSRQDSFEVHAFHLAGESSCRAPGLDQVPHLAFVEETGRARRTVDTGADASRHTMGCTSCTPRAPLGRAAGRRVWLVAAREPRTRPEDRAMEAGGQWRKGSVLWVHLKGRPARLLARTGTKRWELDWGS